MIRVSIEDTSMELAVCVSVSGGYNPDVLDDVNTRAVEDYRRALLDKMAVMHAAQQADQD